MFKKVELHQSEEKHYYKIIQLSNNKNKTKKKIQETNQLIKVYLLNLDLMI